MIEDCMTTAEVNGYCSEHAKEYDPEAYDKFRQHKGKKQVDRYKDRCKTDPHFKLGMRLRTRLCNELRRVGKSDQGKLKYLGCTLTQLRQYFEHNHFQEDGKEWMSWKNWGQRRCHENRSWEIDHIMPISSFDLTDPEEVKKCFHWSNLQPLSWQDNAGKRDTIPEDFEWCNVNERWLWSKASRRMNYELPQ